MWSLPLARIRRYSGTLQNDGNNSLFPLCHIDSRICEPPYDLRVYRKAKGRLFF